MKKILFLLTICLFFLTSCSKEKQFDEKLKVAYQEMSNTLISSTIHCAVTTLTWKTAIYENKTPSGKYCSNFNEALDELSEGYRKNGILDTLYVSMKRMQTATSKLNNPPSSRKECYDDFIEIVADVSSYYRMAIAPSGSLNTYDNQRMEAEESISKKIDLFKIKYAEIIKIDEK